MSLMDLIWEMWRLPQERCDLENSLDSSSSSEFDGFDLGDVEAAIERSDLENCLEFQQFQ